MTSPLLHANNVSRRYSMRSGTFGRIRDVHAVDSVSLTLYPGETIGLVGESGCGKSTTGRLLLGLEMPDGGTVDFDGVPMPKPGIPSWRRLRARMQLVYQDPLSALDRRLTIGDQVAEPLEIHGIGTRAERPERVASLLHGVGLQPGYATRYSHELSGGQRQRVVLARALASQPSLLVCDEPISALDVSIQAQVMNLLVAVQERTGVAMVFISHDLRAVRQMSHRLAVMYLGRIVEEGEPDAILQSPAHPYSQALVAAIPHPTRRGTRVTLEGDPPNPAARPSGCAFHPRCTAAGDLCTKEVPALKPLAHDGRRVACHVAHGDAPSSRARLSLHRLAMDAAG